MSVRRGNVFWHLSITILVVAGESSSGQAWPEDIATLKVQGIGHFYLACLKSKGPRGNNVLHRNKVARSVEAEDEDSAGSGMIEAVEAVTAGLREIKIEKQLAQLVKAD